MTALFLDANIVLDFYRFGPDDLAEIEKLRALVEDREVTLFATEHLRNEISRNRETILSQTIKDLEALKFGFSVPKFIEKSPEAGEIRELLKQANAQHSALLARLRGEIEAVQLPADAVIERLFELAAVIYSSDALELAAIRRKELGHPPGKRQSIGDALHWLSLLNDKRIYGISIVSRDGDFASDLQQSAIKSFLRREWREHKGEHAPVLLYSSLSKYLQIHHPQIVLSDEARKNELISELRASPNFSTTHGLISDLSKYTYFTRGQVDRLFSALVNNTQVGWIGTDDDVKDFYMSLREKAWEIPPHLREAVPKILGVSEDEFFEIPF